MSKLVVMSVFDQVAGMFSRPYYALSVGAGVRGFQDECNRADPDNVVNKHTKDFDLYHLGSFDEESGRFELGERPELVARGAQLTLKLEA